MKDCKTLENKLEDITDELQKEKLKKLIIRRKNKQNKHLRKNSQKEIDTYCGEYQNRARYLEQQIESMKIAHSLELQSKNAESKSLKRQAQLNFVENS